MKNNFILFLCAIILGIGLYSIDVTYASPQAPQVISVSCEGYENSNNVNQKFVTFVNTAVTYTVQSSSPLDAYNYDGIDVQVYDRTDGVYEVVVYSDKAINTQIIFENQTNYSFVEIEFVVDTISNIKISTSYMINKNYDNDFSIVYNDNENLKYGGEFQYFLTINNDSQLLDMSSPYVKKMDANGIRLNFSALSQNNVNAKLTIQVGEIIGSIDFVIQQIPLCNEFIIENTKINYLEGTSQIIIVAMIDNNTYANFVVKNNSVEISNIQLVNKIEGYDVYEIYLDIDNISEDTLIISVISTTGEIKRGVQLNLINEFSSFEIVSNKSSYDPNETIIINAVLNNGEILNGNIDWYINDVKYTTGSSLIYQRSEGGAFNVYAKFNDKVSNTLNLNIIYQGTELIVWYCVFIIALAILVSLLIFKKKKKNFYVTASLVERTNKILPRYNTFINNYNKRQFKNLIYDVAVLKSDTTQNFNDTKDFSFDVASRALGSVQQSMSKIYKSSKEERQNLMISSSNSIEDNLKIAINAYEEFNKTLPEVKRKKSKKNKDKKVENKGNMNTNNINNSLDKDNNKSINK